jgi:hypothetical protein
MNAEIVLLASKEIGLEIQIKPNVWPCHKAKITNSHVIGNHLKIFQT